MRTRLPDLALLAFIVAAATAPAVHAGDAASLALTGADETRLAAGGTVVRMAPAKNARLGEGIAWRILEAPAERLYRAVADWSHYAEFFPFVVASDAEIDGAGRTVVRQRVDLPFPWPDRRFAAVAESAPGTVRWRLLQGSGNVRANRGAWRLTPLGPERTLVELRLLSDAGTTVPAAVQRRALERTLPWALDGLRQHVGRCRYDLPIHPTCRESPPWPAAAKAVR
jgi:ribosome-associated toxin RatA of RatAB toxin-antitoxin module